LLHACCAPCSTVPLERLTAYEISVLCYGPNIQPHAEYLWRLEEERRLCRLWGFELIEAPYRPAEWGRAILPHRDLPEGSERCASCFRLRMTETARRARAGGFDAFAVTLTVSPHKSSPLITRIGNEVAAAEGIPYLAEDFKKQGGTERSLHWSRQLPLRRQFYCGCSLSRAEALARRRQRQAHA
jgi:predicted adenine nucleotide alpha hydrolase (AANH) superfamily ATPase